MLPIYTEKNNTESQLLCNKFLNEKPDKRFIFGINEYAQSIANQIEVAAFIDDFTSEKSYLGKPIINREDIPSDSLVVSAVVYGRPLTVKNILEERGHRHIDYFSFYKYSGVDIMPVKCWAEFEQDYFENKDKYSWVYDLLSDQNSKDILEKIVNFRLSANLFHMEGFTERQKEQYFEDFLLLNSTGEVFCDVGSYDGFTTLEFIKRCPNYRSAYIFEPEPKNMEIIKKRLVDKDNIFYIQSGLSNKKDTVRFSANGSSSMIDNDGEIEINVNLLDSLVKDKVSFIKMDIEGAEKLAIDGSRQTILENHPRLAICVYHKEDDLYRIPELIFSIRDDYSVYLRHYTEGVTETVMFFIPK